MNKKTWYFTKMMLLAFVVLGLVLSELKLLNMIAIRVLPFVDQILAAETFSLFFLALFKVALIFGFGLAVMLLTFGLFLWLYEEIDKSVV